MSLLNHVRTKLLTTVVFLFSTVLLLAFSYRTTVDRTSLKKRYLKGLRNPIPDKKPVLNATTARSTTDSPVSEVANPSFTALLNGNVREFAEDNFPPLDSSIINVSNVATGYRIRISDAASRIVAIPFNTMKIPRGYSALDVHTFYFNRSRQQWSSLQRSSIDVEKSVVYSEAQQDGEYINGIIKVPQSPETQGYLPTTMSDMKVGDPASMIQYLPVPQANNQGSANLSYTIEIPPGRNRIQPDLSVSYNSNGGSGWLGEGWNINGLSSITVDSRWGVPKYSSDKETETYLIDGQMLAFMQNNEAVIPHRTPGISRIADRQFYPRKLSDFKKIIRRGTKPDNYWWEITDKSGTKYYYGGFGTSNPEAVLRNAEGSKKSIAEWKLFHVEDVFGNYMDYHYDIQTTHIRGSAESAQCIYLNSVTYTGFSKPGSDDDRRPPNYRIRFDRAPKTGNDIVLNGRYGFLTTMADSLIRVEVSIIALKDKLTVPQVVRSYQFKYIKGAFDKTLLADISQYGAKGTLFYEQKFDYFNQSDDNSIFLAPVVWNTPNDGVEGKINTPIISRSSTAIGSGVSKNKGYSMYFGLGLLGDEGSKEGTVGIQIASNSSTSNGLVTLIDVSGDGRPDKLFVKDNKLQYHENNGHGFEKASIAISGVDASDFYEETTRSNSRGFQGLLGSFSIGTDKTSSVSTTNIYMADKNGDGLVDLVTNNVVYFNLAYHGGNVHHFSRLSSATGVPINTENGITGFSPGIPGNYRSDVEKSNPLHEAVRVWEAPFDGRVTVIAPLQLSEPDPDEKLTREFKEADGLKASIQLGGRQPEPSRIIDAASVPPNNYNTVFDTPKTFNITKGQRIYFRLQSGIENASNGSFDRVIWNPRIVYSQYDLKKFQNDIYNRSIYRYDSKEDFLLSNSGSIAIDSGASHLKLKGTFHKDITADTVAISILQLRRVTTLKPGNGDIERVDYIQEKILFNASYKPDEVINTTFNQELLNTTTNERIFRFVISPKSNIDQSAIRWRPVVSYLNRVTRKCMSPAGIITDCSTTEIDSKPIYIVPHSIFSDSLHSKAVNWTIPDSDNYTLIASLRFRDKVRASGSFAFTVRDRDGLLIRKIINYPAGIGSTAPVEMALRLLKGQELLPSYELLDALRTEIEAPSFEIKNELNNAEIELKKPTEVTTVQNAQVFTVKYDGRYAVRPFISLVNTKQKGSLAFEIINTVTKAVLGSASIAYDSSSVVYPDPALIISLKAGEKIKLKFSTTDADLSSRIKVASVRFNQGNSAFLWTKRADEKFGPMYRGWGQFVYNGMDSRAANLINEGDLFVKRASNSIMGNAAGKINELRDHDRNTDVSISSLDELSPVNAIFSRMGPYADDTHWQWQGGDADIFLSADLVSSSRLGSNSVTVDDPFVLKVTPPSTTDKSYGFAVSKVVSSTNNSSFKGVSPFTVTSSHTDDSRMVSDFIDLNGDRYPDIVSNGQVQLTNAQGGFEAGAEPLSHWHKSVNSSEGIGLSGGIYHSGGSGTSKAGNNRNSGKPDVVAAGSASATGNANVNIGATGAGYSGQDQTTATWLDVNADGLADQVFASSDAGSMGFVMLNLGNNKFTGKIQYDTGMLSKGRSMSVSPSISLGVSYSNQSYASGIGLSVSSSNAEFNLQDFNGDGLIDRTSIDNAGRVTVQFNKGLGFTAGHFADIGIQRTELQNAGATILPVQYIPGIRPFTGIRTPVDSWMDLERTKFSGSVGESLGGSFTFGFNEWIPPTPFIRFVFNPAVNLSQGMGENFRQFTDIDGDGFLDYLYSTDESKLYVSLSKLGKLNKLKQIINPLGGRYVLDYEPSIPTIDNPRGKWVLSSVIGDDGQDFDRLDDKKFNINTLTNKVLHNGPKLGLTYAKSDFDFKKEFAYSAGRYDRYEREFLGFARVETKELDFDESVLRSQVQIYDTANYYVAGNLLNNYVVGSGNERYTLVEQQYYLNAVNPASNDDYSLRTPVTNDYVRQNRLNGICFSALKKATQYSFERNTTPIVLNGKLYSYNPTGSVDNFKYKEGAEVTDAGFDYETRITLVKTNPSKYIIDQTESVIIKKDTILRYTNAKYNQLNGTLSETNSFFNRTQSVLTTIKYDKFGNIESRKMSDGIEYTYGYDDGETNTFLQTVSDNFSLSSSTKYDKGFGIPVQTEDLNDNHINYELDEFGRIKRIIGPKECNNDISNPDCQDKFTILISYSVADANFPPGIALSKLTHYDTAHPSKYNAGAPLSVSGIQTINFVDGFGRSVQVKKTASLTQNNGKPNKDVKWTVSGRVLYDAAGRAVRTYFPTTDQTIDGLVLSKEINSAHPTIAEFDALDRTIRVVAPDDSLLYTSEYTTRNNLSLSKTVYHNTKNNGGDQTKLFYNNGSGLKAIEGYINPNGDTVKTIYKYDPIHQLTGVTDNSGNITITRYDIAGRKTGYDHADADNIKFEYNRAGQLASKVNADGQRTVYSYDRNRLVAIAYSQHPENNVRYVYGANDDQCKPCRGKLIYQEDATGAQAFEYGSQGETEKTTRTIVTPFNGKTYTFITAYKYDSWNRIQSITYPDNEKVTYIYNDAGLLDKITGIRGANTKLPAVYKSFDYVTKIGYDEFDQRTYFEYGNKTKTSFTYQPDRRRMNQLQISKTSSLLGSAPLFTSFYSYDNQSNIIQYVNKTVKQPNLPGVDMTHRYTYDNVNRLSSASGNWSSNGQNATYKLGMGYDNLFNVTHKNLILNSSAVNTDYDCTLTYATDKPHQINSLNELSHRNNNPFYDQNNTEYYSYDGQGNNDLKSTSDKHGNESVQERKILWDEGNRILAVSMNGYVSSYVYDASGERTIKLSTEGDGVAINGQFGGDYIKPTTLSLYANPYYSMRNGDGLYTKHIYIENQRIVSQVENELSFDNQDIKPSDQSIRARCLSTIHSQASDFYTKSHLSLNNAINSYYNYLQVPHQQLLDNAFLTNPPVNETKIPDNPYYQNTKTLEKLPTAGGPAMIYSYFYHINHLGSTSFVTDITGSVMQYVEYLPFGETFMEQRQNYSSQFMFNGKEQDQETGLNYFGARYYDNHNYQWLGIDQKSEQYAGLSPYNYCLNNPVTMMDPDGRFAIAAVPLGIAAYEAFQATLIVGTVATVAVISSEKIQNSTNQTSTHGGLDVFSHAFNENNKSKSRSQPKEEGTPDFTEIKVNEKGEFIRDKEGRIDKYNTYDKEGKLVKEYRGSGKDHFDKEAGKRVKRPSIKFRGDSNIDEGGNVRPGKWKVEEASPDDIPSPSQKQDPNISEH